MDEQEKPRKASRLTRALNYLDRNPGKVVAGLGAAYAATVAPFAYNYVPQNQRSSEQFSGNMALGKEVEEGRFNERTRTRVEAYFDRYLMGGTDHPDYALFTSGLHENLSKLPADQKIALYTAMSSKWSELVKDAPGKKDTPRLQEAGEIGARLTFGKITGYSEKLAENPGAYFKELEAWAETFEPHLPQIVAAQKEEAKGRIAEYSNQPDQIPAELEVIRRDAEKQVAAMDADLKRGNSMVRVLREAQKAYEGGNMTDADSKLTQFMDYVTKGTSGMQKKDLRGQVDPQREAVWVDMKDGFRHAIQSRRIAQQGNDPLDLMNRGPAGPAPAR